MAEFKKPLSRNEAILQNILGASNVLESPKSRVEAILQAILNETEYNETAKSRIEEILLAILNGEDYSGEGMSRNEKILIAGLKGEEWTEAPKSRIEELLIEWANNGLSVEWLIYTGTNSAVLQDTMSRPVKAFTFYGRSEVINQYLPTTAFPSNEASGVTFTNNGDGTYTITGKATAQVATDSYYPDIPVGHIILARGQRMQFRMGGSSVVANVGANGTIRELTGAPEFRLMVTNGTSVNTTSVPQVFDLTALYGSGNEPSDVDTFKADHPELYFSYNPTNVILSAVNPSAVLTDGTDENSIIASYTLLSVGTAKDELVVRSDGTGKLTRNVGRANLGSGSWTKTNDDVWMSTYSGIVNHAKGNSVPMCVKYAGATPAANNADAYRKGNMTTCFRYPTFDRIYIRDDGFSGTAQEFRTYVSGVYVYFELETPVETELTADQVLAILNGAKTFSPTTTISASNENGLDQEFEIEYAHKAGANA